MRIFARIILCISKASRSCKRTFVKEVNAIASGFPIRRVLDCIIDAQSASVCLNLGTDEAIYLRLEKLQDPRGT